MCRCHSPLNSKQYHLRHFESLNRSVVKTKSSEVRLQLGRMAISLSGNNDITRYVIEELGSLLPPTTRDPNVAFYFVRTLPQPQGIVYGNTVFGENCMWMLAGGMQCHIRWACEYLEVTIATKVSDLLRNPFLRRVRRIRNWNYLTKEEEIAKNFIYDVFDWTTQLAQLPRKQTYVHASAAQKYGRTVILSGARGVGKSSSILKLCSERGWQYLSDDLLIVDDSGIAYCSPKNMQIYGYNVEGEAELSRRLLDGRSLDDRMAWFYRKWFYGAKKVRRRVSPRDFYGDLFVAKCGRVTDLLILERTTDASWNVQDICLEEASVRLSEIIMSELEPLPTIAREARACGFHSFPAQNHVQAEIQSILLSGLMGLQPKVVRVGPQISPTRIVAFLEEVVLSRSAI